MEYDASMKHFHV